MTPVPGTDDPTLASRYLAGQLSTAECEDYEARFLRDPEIVAELEATARFKVGLQRLRQTGELGALVRQRVWAAPPVALALAATIAAAVIGISVWYPRPSHAPRLIITSSVSALHDPSGKGLAILVTQSMFRTRAAAYDAVIALPPQRGAVELRVQPTDLAPSARYRATLARLRADDSLEPGATLAPLSPGTADGFISVYADSSQLAPGRYRLVLSREDLNPPGSGEAFTIKVTAGPAPR
ncbi:MAG TPA: hypothetical protein VLX90_01165 [Steroidobacteraceae bacterium]|nr:hypothetical protein [Steroidobacteraceae bacterium]